MITTVRLVLIGLGVVLGQWLVLGHLRLWGAFPDALLLFVAWVSLRYGRRAGMASGFLMGLVFDALYDTWGIHMFIKTLVGFSVGSAPDEERQTLLILPRQAFYGGLAIALFHNGLEVIFLVLRTGTATLDMALSLWLGSALYTAVLGTLAALFSTR